MRWAVAGALAWIGLLICFVAFQRWPPPPLKWVVTHTSTAHRTMVVTIQANAPSRSLLIAREIVQPVQSRYNEILIYVWPPGNSTGLPARRIQWTTRGGYVETVFSEDCDGAPCR
jgi:hypothetical protein